MFGYFFGTVLYVKTNIRERGSRVYLVASVGWHAACTLLAVVLAWLTLVAWSWAAFFAVTTGRAAAVPGRRWSVKQIGFLEVGMSTLLVADFLAWGV